MYRFATAPAGCVVHGRTENPSRDFPAPLMSVAQILRLVERRLAWYGFDDWRIRDVICNADPSVTVIVRGPARAQLALTVARDGAPPSRAELKPAPLMPAQAPGGLVSDASRVVPHIARAVSTRTGDAVFHEAGREYVLRPATQA